MQAAVKGAVEVPIFVEEESNDPSSLLKKASALAMGGFWLGGTHMKPNPAFMRDVQAKIPKDARIIVTCQKGLRCAPSIPASPQHFRVTGHAVSICRGTHGFHKHHPTYWV